MMGTRELLKKIISMMSQEDVFEARMVNSFWKDTVSGLSRLPKFRQDMRRRLFFEPAEVGPVERGTALPRGYVNPKCTATSIWHADCERCCTVLFRENAVVDGGPYSMSGSRPGCDPPGLELQRHEQTRHVVVGAHSRNQLRAKHWLDFEQFVTNPMLERMLGTSVREREGRIDFDIKESVDGTFTFVRSREAIAHKMGSSWEETFLTQPPCQSISIMMTDRHLGRREIATCNNDTGIWLSQIFEKLESIAIRVANHSAGSIRAFLMKQPADQVLPPPEADKMEFVSQNNSNEEDFKRAEFWAKEMDRQTWVEKRTVEVDSRSYSGATLTSNRPPFGLSIERLSRAPFRHAPRSWTAEDCLAKYKENFKDWRWMHGVVPPAKMEISFILKRREAVVGDLSEHDLT